MHFVDYMKALNEKRNKNKQKNSALHTEIKKNEKKWKGLTHHVWNIKR